jgi:hypothetical protein
MIEKRLHQVEDIFFVIIIFLLQLVFGALNCILLT